MRIGTPYSPVFIAAVDQFFEDEGYHSNDPVDPGGDTYYGIARADHPDVPWPPTKPQATDLLWREYWVPSHLDELPAPVAMKVFNVGVNIGMKSAIICLQRACRGCGGRMVEDGVLGPATATVVKMASERHPDGILWALRSELAAHYRLVAVAKPDLGERDLRGWLNRAYA